MIASAWEGSLLVPGLIVERKAVADGVVWPAGDCEGDAPGLWHVIDVLP